MKTKDFRAEFFQYLRQAYGAPALAQMQALPPLEVQGRYPAFRDTMGRIPMTGQVDALPGMAAPLSPQLMAPGVMQPTTREEQTQALNNAAPMLSRMG